MQVFFLLFLNICIGVEDPIFKKGRVIMPLTGLTPPQRCAWHKPELGFLTPYVVNSVIVFNELGWQVCVRFVNIGGITDNNCLNFLSSKHKDFRKYKNRKWK